MRRRAPLLQCMGRCPANFLRRQSPEGLCRHVPQRFFSPPRARISLDGYTPFRSISGGRQQAALLLMCERLEILSRILRTFQSRVALASAEALFPKRGSYTGLLFFSTADHVGRARDNTSIL